MANGVKVTCLVCNRRVREGEVYCYLHKDAPVAANPEIDGLSTIEIFKKEQENFKLLNEITKIVHRKSASSLSLAEVSAEFIAMESRLDFKTALKVVDAGEIINARRPMLNVPSYVAQNFQGLLNEMEVDLLDSGIEENRISRLQMWDAERQIGNGLTERSAEVGHMVLVIDRGLETESTVDVGISMFAPVSNPNISVADQYDTKFSPFGYAPLVSTVETYKTPQYLWFKNFRYLD